MFYTLHRIYTEKHCHRSECLRRRLKSQSREKRKVSQLTNHHFLSSNFQFSPPNSVTSYFEKILGILWKEVMKIYHVTLYYEMILWKDRSLQNCRRQRCQKHSPKANISKLCWLCVHICKFIQKRSIFHNISPGQWETTLQFQK